MALFHPKEFCSGHGKPGFHPVNTYSIESNLNYFSLEIDIKYNKFSLVH